MPGWLRSKMGESLGCDFSSVRVYEGSAASEIGAKAFARGNEVHFAPGAYDPASRAGLELLGHELAHVAQQAQGRVDATTTLGKGMEVNDDPGLEREADARGALAAAHVLSLDAPSSAAPILASASHTQRPVAQGKFYDGKTGLEPGEAEKRIKKALKRNGFHLDSLDDNLREEIRRIANADDEEEQIGDYVQRILDARLVRESKYRQGAVEDSVVAPGVSGCAAIKINAFVRNGKNKRLVESIVFHSDGTQKSKQSAAEIAGILNDLKPDEGVLVVEILSLRNGNSDSAREHNQVLKALFNELDPAIKRMGADLLGRRGSRVVLS